MFSFEWDADNYRYRPIAERFVVYAVEVETPDHQYTRAHMPKGREDYRTPEKRRAASAIGNMKYRGEYKPQPCATCGTAKTEAHHPDYEKPYSIVWLCRRCHRAAHKEMKRVL